jgi:hypothetical protein
MKMFCFFFLNVLTPDSGLNRVDLYCTLWVGAWTSCQRPSEALVASDFAHGKACDGMMTETACSGEVSPIWRKVIHRQVRSSERSGEGGVPNTNVVAWLMNKKLVSASFIHCLSFLTQNSAAGKG